MSRTRPIHLRDVKPGDVITVFGFRKGFSLFSSEVGGDYTGQVRSILGPSNYGETDAIQLFVIHLTDKTKVEAVCGAKAVLHIEEIGCPS